MLTNGFGVSGEATVESAIPPTVQLAFYIGAFVFFLGVLYTIFTTREYPPEDLAAFEKAKRESAGLGHAFREIFRGIGSMPGADEAARGRAVLHVVRAVLHVDLLRAGVAKGIFKGAPLGASNATVDQALDDPQNAALLDAAARAARSYEELKRQVAAAVPAGEARGGALDGVITMLGLKAPPPDPAARITAAELASALERSLAAGGAPASEADRTNPMVRTVASLLGQNGLAPGAVAAPASLQSASGALVLRLASARRYQEGVSWAGVCFAAYNLVAFAFSFLLLALVKRFSARSIHIACLALGGLGLLSVLGVREPSLLLASMVGVGVAWASSSPCRTPCSRTPCPRRRWASTWASSTFSSCCPRSSPRSGSVG